MKKVSELLNELEKFFSSWTDRLYDTIPNKDNLRESEKSYIEGQISILDPLEKLIDKWRSRN